MKTVIIIPARYQSSRLPGKPLVKILGKEMIVRVWERCIKAIPQENVYVATDDKRIETCCRNAGIQVVLTSSDCLTGTDRVYEASLKIPADIYVNVQGDEPLINPKDIQKVIDAAQNNPDTIINAMCLIKEEKDYFSTTIPKVVARPDGDLLYMSRAPIPGNKQNKFVTAMKQVCIYGFTPEALKSFVQSGKKTPLEEQEDIEILRFLEFGYKVQMIEVSQSSIAVDIPEDILRVEEVIKDAETE